MGSLKISLVIRIFCGSRRFSSLGYTGFQRTVPSSPVARLCYGTAPSLSVLSFCFPEP